MTKSRTGFRARRGRPPVSRIAVDPGTPELVAKRALGVTSEVIDIFHNNGRLTDYQLKAALRFRWLYTLRFGVPSIQCIDMTGMYTRIPTIEDSKWRADRQNEYREAAHMLEAHGLLNSVLRGAVFNDPALLHPTDKEAKLSRQRFREGLDALTKLWRY